MSGNSGALYGYLRMPLILALRQGPVTVDAPLGVSKHWEPVAKRLYQRKKYLTLQRGPPTSFAREERASPLTKAAMNAPG